MTKKQPANNKQKQSRNKRQPALIITQDICFRITRSANQLIAVTLENNSEQDIWKVDMYSKDLIRRDQVDVDGSYLIFTPFQTKNTLELFTLPDEFFEDDMTIMFDIYVKKGAAAQKYYINVPTLSDDFPKRPSDTVVLPLNERDYDDKTLKERVDERRKDTANLYKISGKNMKEQWIEAAKKFYDKLTNATYEERVHAMAMEESVAEKYQDIMIRLDYSVYYNQGLRVNEIPEESRPKYYQWLQDWGLGEPNGKPEKRFEPMEHI